MEEENTFKQWKKQCFNKMDFSKKGSIDKDINAVVSFLNDSDNYFTTSSCSGRIILIDGVKVKEYIAKLFCMNSFLQVLMSQSVNQSMNHLVK